MADKVETGTIGLSFEAFLKQEGTLDAATEQATKRVGAYQDLKSHGMSETDD